MSSYVAGGTVTPHTTMQNGANGTYTPDCNYSFPHFAERNFKGGVPGHFTRKELRHQLLRYTPDEDKKVNLKVGSE